MWNFVTWISGFTESKKKHSKVPFNRIDSSLYIVLRVFALYNVL